MFLESLAPDLPTGNTQNNFWLHMDYQEAQEGVMSGSLEEFDSLDDLFHTNI